MAVHLRQYLIGPEPRPVRDDWRSMPLADGIVLSYCPTLPVQRVGRGLRLGDAIVTDEASDDPEAWAGRWILLEGTRLRLDAGGLLAAFTRAVDGARWVSSSPAILRALAPELARGDDRLARDWRVMDWYPPPGSAVPGIGRVLPSQVLDLRDGSLAPRALPQGRDDQTGEALLERVGRRLLSGVRGAAEIAAGQGGRLWVGLTSGRDSRLVLAAALAAGLEPVTYTFIREKTSRGDRDVPPRLAAAAGLEHRTIPMDTVDEAKVRAFDEHTAFGYAGGARTQYTTSGWDRVDDTAVALEGGGFEFGRCYYFDRLPRDMPGSAVEASAAIFGRFPSERRSDIEAWCRWVLGEGRQDGLDWRDRFYLEQRMAGWLSSGLQGFDISGRRQVHIAACDALLADLVSIPVPQRRSGEHEEELVRRLAPALATLPYNPGAKGGAATAASESGRSGGRLRRVRLPGLRRSS